MRLRHYTDGNPGITRRRQGTGFSYLDTEGTVIGDPEERARIAALAVPPAYENVWISPFANNYLLASGRDDKDRKQYIYHEKWRAKREAAKFAHLADVGAAMPSLRRWIASRLSEDSDRKETAIATALALIERGSLRPGSASYTRANASHGATTLLPQHFTQDGTVSVLSYKAKGGQQVEKRVPGARLARLLAKQKARGTEKLIMWRDGSGSWCPVQSSDLNACLASLCGEGFSVKALRTWNGTLAAFRAAQTLSVLTKKAIAEAASETLHNTPAIAQKSYIHPDVLLLSDMAAHERAKVFAECGKSSRSGSRAGEDALLTFLS